jgi:hypothetical protein
LKSLNKPLIKITKGGKHGGYFKEALGRTRKMVNEYVQLGRRNTKPMDPAIESGHSRRDLEGWGANARGRF